ncbi:MULTISPECIES: glycosyltransferase family 4 protein [Marinobacter]|uniref:glycosyltransferase family 4 protein n=1 Tax=Marinobacter TaxID=2742 RepID=UPI0012491DED|nr:MULTISPECIES: glycosyltransferase family 4 protein [Marinobacter]MBL3556705.1 glycosyltransferase [Marinobacter sp. JB05H06]
MKLLWLSHLIPYPPKGGVLQRTYNMIKEVSKYHEITLVAFNQAGFLSASLPDQNDPLEYAKQELLKCVESIHVLDIPEDAISGGRYLTALKALFCGQAYNMEWLKSAEARDTIASLLAEKSFDAVHIDTISLCVYSDLLKGLPVVLNHHNFESAMLRARSKTEQNPVKSLYYKYEASRLWKSEVEHCRHSSLNVTCSDEDAESMKAAIGDGEFISVPNGADVSYFYPNSSVTVAPKSIVIVGGLSWYPNREAVEYFIREIWPLIKVRLPDMRVDIIGRDPTPEMLKLAETDELFRVHGFVDDVRDYLWRAQFYICPIRTGGGTKLKILDALASGCCIIADPFACKGIKVQDGIDVTFAQTPESYVDAIVDLLGNPEKEARLRKAGPELIRNRYSYLSIGKRYAEALDQLAPRRASGNGSELNAGRKDYLHL